MVVSAFYEGLRDSARRAWCLTMQGANNYWRFMRNTANLWLNGNGSALPYVSICNPPAPPPIPFPPPRGACNGPYQIASRGSWFNAATQTTITIPLEVWFPCNAPRFGPISDPVGIRLPSTATQDNLRLTITARATTNGPIQTFNLNNFTVPKDSYWVTYETQLTRCNGLPDNCGTGIGEPPFQLDWNIINLDFDYFDGSSVVTVPVQFTWVDASLNLDGTLNANFRVQLNVPLSIPVNVSGTLNLGTGDVNFNLGNDNDIRINIGGDTITDVEPPPPPPPPSTTEPPPPPPPDPVDPNIPPRQTIRGAIVSIITFEDTAQTVIGQSNIPDVIVPYAGLVSFLIKVNGVSSWTADIPVKNARQFVPCPWEGGAVNVRFSPRSSGTTAAVLPVYGLSEESLRFIRV